MPPSLAGVSPGVAGAAATTGARSAHGQREVEEDQRSDAGPADIRKGRALATLRISTEDITSELVFSNPIKNFSK